MKKKVGAVFLILAVLATIVCGMYLYPVLMGKDVGEICFYSDFGNGIKEYEKTNVVWDNPSLSLPKDPVREGYIFGGWYLDNGTFNTKYDLSYFENNEFTEKTNVFAKWIICEHENTNVTTIKPTCVAAGSNETVCLDCGKTLENKTLNKLEHNYVGELVCEIANGEKIFKCTVRCTEGCNLSETKNNVEVTTTLASEPTCDKEGAERHTYEIYGVTFECTTAVEMISHKISGVSYDDVINENDGKVPHDFPGVFLSATDTIDCGTECTAYYQCSECQSFVEIYAYRFHHFTEWEVVRESTCISSGWQTRHCINENLDGACNYEEGENVDKIPHDYNLALSANGAYTEFTLGGKCKVNGCNDRFTETVEVQETTLVALSCFTDGELQYSCEYEGVVYTLNRTVYAPMYHSLAGRSVPGYWYDERGWLSLEIPGVHGLDDISGLKCYSEESLNGWEGYYICECCGDSFSATVYVPHDWQNFRLEKDGDTFNLLATCCTENKEMCVAENVSVRNSTIKAATCNATGTVRYTYTNSRYPERNCYLDVVVEIDDTKHKSGGLYTVNTDVIRDGKLDITKYPNVNYVIFNLSGEPECQVEYDGCYICDVCNQAFSIKIVRGHNFGGEKFTDPSTCTSAGRDYWYCQYDNCDAIEEVGLPPLKHNYQYALVYANVVDGVVVNPEEVVILQYCPNDNCGLAEEITEFDVVTYTLESDPTCVDQGVETYVCTKGELEYVVVVITDIDADGHGFGVGGDIDEHRNADGSVDSDVEGIYIIWDSPVVDGKCRGGYICAYCGKFVEIIEGINVVS